MKTHKASVSEFVQMANGHQRGVIAVGGDVRDVELTPHELSEASKRAAKSLSQHGGEHCYHD